MASTDPNELVEIYLPPQDPRKIERLGSVTRAAYDETFKAKGWKIAADVATEPKGA